VASTSLSKTLSHSWSAYRSNGRLVLLSGISLIIAFLIPVFASLPTYDDLGGIFIRTASLYLNLTPLSAAVIAISLFFSLLFLSFAAVIMNIIIKHSRTSTKVGKEVMDAIEKYTGRVFVVLLLYTAVVFAADAALYGTAYAAAATSIAALLMAPLVFYAPSSIVIDDNGIVRSMRASARFFFRRLDYFAAWIVIAVVLLTIIDAVMIPLTGTMLSRYLMLAVSSLFVLPFLMLLQGESYMSRFGLLH
jgi:hypothetical protein